MERKGTVMNTLRACFPVCAAALLLAAQTARADMKIVSEMTVQGQPGAQRGGQPQRQTVRAFYKGDKVRTEAAGTILIYDAAADKLLQLDPARKTYTVNALQKMAAQMQPLMARMKFDVTGSVRPGGATRTIVGLPARNYRVAMNLRMSMPAAGAGAPQGMPAGPLLTMKLEGEQWASEAVKVPVRVQRMMTTSLMRPMGAMMPGMKPLLDKMAAVKGLPLSSRMTMTMTMGQAMGGAAPRNNTMTAVTEVRSIDRKTVLPAALFAIPAGYRKVEPGPGMPGGMGGVPGR
jgi:hypothetical protein